MVVCWDEKLVGGCAPSKRSRAFRDSNSNGMSSISDRRRPLSFDHTSETAKKVKLNHPSPISYYEDAFSPGLLSSESASRLRQIYVTSEPFKHCVISSLFDVELLKNVQDELTRELVFTEKETDIYKVRGILRIRSQSHRAKLFARFTKLAT
jgi:hypothetical protein